MDIRHIIEKEITKNCKDVRIENVPDNMKPTYKSLQKLDMIISTEVRANNVMSLKSSVYALGR